MSLVEPGQVESLQQAIEKYWGYTTFRPLQREAMETVLARQDSVVVLPTGGGKSLCFQAPAVVQGGLSVVVSPLISLMKDQVDTLVANGVPAVCAARERLEQLAAAIEADPQQTVVVDLAAGQVRSGDLVFPCTMQEGARQALLEGQWDFLSQLVEAAPRIRETVANLPYMKNFA